ncbi:uncharacterized protein DUF3237 [Comamonas sp. BIGb0124]|jgi:hypothetical protein|uniref:DUF3237 domain-containing protein n=1 Tax=Comamonas sp. BIGb0124 TaxID=2485130 RepID=UPI000FAB9001|nr:DUF3237 domain-containing protein [Comamonas sp. BIGb0124]ROR17090.1 uncharacterized protein DUF3237 [Comamonas sp. BIGb0124]
MQDFSFPGAQMPVIAAPGLRPFADLLVEVGAVQDVGLSPYGGRRLIPIVGGRAGGVHSGRAWSARVLAGGADHQRIVGATLAELDARYVLETDAGELIYVANRAVRSAAPEVMQRLARGEPVNPDQVYFRCTPTFETAAPRWAWLSERLFVGNGVRLPGQVALRFFEVL